MLYDQETSYIQSRAKKSKPQEAEYGVTFSTIQVKPAVKQILKIESSRRLTEIGALVAELVIARYGDDPEYREILKEAGLVK